ncbi:FecR domain-containing protein [Catalinimonas sp. 4WD22]|uniref:FecR family protein n=1 Tax=Catalinimonas locisalis TaxID=3133978 RepID=UPI0031019A13
MEKPSFWSYVDYQVEDFLVDENFQQWVQEADAASEEYWQQFLQRYPQKKEQVEQARILASSIRYHPQKLSAERQREILHNAYAGTDKKTISLPNRKPISFSYRAAAAAVVLLFISGIAYWFALDNIQVYQTAARENKTIILADGSEVTLNANTKISVLIDEEADQARQVWLDGEAFFEVKRLSTDQYENRPKSRNFIVHTSNFDIEVLGTSFNVSSRLQKSEILLKTGKVKVESKQINKTQVLQPGDMLSLAQQENSFMLRKEPGEAELAWRENFFIFENTPLKEVAEAIENYYGLEVQIMNEAVEGRQFTAKLSRNNLPVLLEAIEESFQVEVVRKESAIQIN